MLDIKRIRENPEEIKKGLSAKFTEIDLDELLGFDQKKRTLLKEVEELKAKRNKANTEIASLKKQKKSADDLLKDLKTLSQKIKEIDQEVGGLSSKTAIMMDEIPNIPLKSVPVAKGAEGNRIVKTWGNPREAKPEEKDHLALASKLGWLSMEAGSKITGAGFAVFFGEGAKLQRALINFMLDIHTKQHGYKEAWPPSIVNRTSMRGTGQIPKLESDMYRLYDPEQAEEESENDFFLIPTGEVPVTNFLRNEILEEKELPLRFAAYTPCFRREAGSYGKDTKGLSRVHQFDKVEMVKFVKPEKSEEELETLVKNAEAILQELELPYRVVLLGSGDMSFAASKCYDLEVWAPATKKWLEVSSCSLFGDFQARRMNIRFKSKSTNKPKYVHTLNGSGVALARTVLCLLENFQTKDGKIKFPKALKPYMQ